MTALRWNWRRKSDGEPMTRLMVAHYLTREDMIDLLCSDPSIETGTQLSQQATLAVIRSMLAAATLLEPVESWAENLTNAEAEQRGAWAESVIDRLPGTPQTTEDMTRAAGIAETED